MTSPKAVGKKTNNAKKGSRTSKTSKRAMEAVVIEQISPPDAKQRRIHKGALVNSDFYTVFADLPD